MEEAHFLRDSLETFFLRGTFTRVIDWGADVFTVSTPLGDLACKLMDGEVEREGPISLSAQSFKSRGLLRKAPRAKERVLSVGQA